MTRPRLLDLFSGAGGSAMGYYRAGFDVVGVDIVDQPHYPFEFVQADAMTFPLDGFDAIHASPPCQDHSALQSSANHVAHDTGWMLAATIDRLRPCGVPWVVENVVSPTVTMDGWWFTLCGTMFPETERIWRHRRFGASCMMLTPRCRHAQCPPPIDVTGQGGPSRRSRKAGSREEAQAVMGIDWMSHAELVQAIPPAYMEFIGAQLLASVERVA